MFRYFTGKQDEILLLFFGVLFAIVLFLSINWLILDVLNCLMSYRPFCCFSLSLSQSLWWTTLLKSSEKGTSIAPEHQTVFFQRGKRSSWPQCKPLLGPAFRSTHIRGKQAEPHQERTEMQTGWIKMQRNSRRIWAWGDWDQDCMLERRHTGSDITGWQHR